MSSNSSCNISANTSYISIEKKHSSPFVDLAVFEDRIEDILRKKYGMKYDCQDYIKYLKKKKL
jgi:hypothetical protein